MNNAAGHYEKNLVEALQDLRDDFKAFVSTRLQMLQVEMKEKMSAIKISMPALLSGALLLATAFLLFTGGLVALIALAFNGAIFAYVAAFFIVCALYALAGGAAAVYGVKTLRAARLKPERTLRVLKQDQIWLQSEAQKTRAA